MLVVIVFDDVHKVIRPASDCRTFAATGTSAPRANSNPIGAEEFLKCFYPFEFLTILTFFSFWTFFLIRNVIKNVAKIVFE